LSFNFNDLSFKGKGFPKDLQDEEMIIRNTFLNAQMGQIVQYGNMQQIKRDRSLMWCDLKTKDKSSPDFQPLAKLVPIQDTIKFQK
jgi:hypothetical protein